MRRVVIGVVAAILAVGSVVAVHSSVANPELPAGDEAGGAAEGSAAETASGGKGGAFASSSYVAKGLPDYDGLVDVIDTTRLGGKDRMGTAIGAAQQFAPGVPVAYLTFGWDFPDAVSASAPAGREGSPILLTGRGDLVPEVARELKRLKPKKIVIVGATGVVSAQIEKEASKIAPTVRLGGKDRYETSRRVAMSQYPDGADHVVIATGHNYPDALVAGPAATTREAPVLLVNGRAGELPADTLKVLSTLGVRSVGIAGGKNAVSKGIEDQLRSQGLAVERYFGATRYETAVSLNRGYFSPTNDLQVLATGTDFPDALAGSALAGSRGTPVILSQRACLPRAVSDYVEELGATSQYVMGGNAVLNASAAIHARCVYAQTDVPLGGWATDDWDYRTDVEAPYFDRPPYDVHNPDYKFDENGVRIYIYKPTGEREDHPVVYAQYGISALLEYEATGDVFWKNRAIAQGQRLIDMHDERDDAWWFSYPFPFTHTDRTLQAPWHSAMAQGQALSLFVRLYEETDDQKWLDAADHTWKSFSQSYDPELPWSSLVIDGHLYLEEYAGSRPPMMVLNGHIFSMFGLYDYWKLTGDQEVKRYLDGATTTVLERMMPLVRVPDDVSYYCVLADYCQTPRWQNKKYHGIHSWQLETLSRLTGDERFTRWSALLREDWVNDEE